MSAWCRRTAGAPGYVPPAAVPQGAATDPAELAPRPQERNFLADFLANFEFRPGAVPPRAAPFAFGQRMAQFTPFGGGQRGVRGMPQLMRPPGGGYG